VQARALRRAKPIPVPNDLPFCKDDVTVVIPTICEDDQLDFFKRTLESVNRTEPHAIIVVTPVTQARSIRKLAASVDKMIEVVGSPCKGKRYQLCLGLSRVRTAITVCADDDVEWRWEDAALLHLLAPFANPHIGAVGTCQQVERTRSRNLPEFFGALYITRRNHETVATNFIDGGLSCLSGRTFAIRTTILQGNQFSEEYLGEKWRGHCLNPDDDNFITRWVWRHEYKIQIQSAEEVVVHTTLATTFSKYLSQCIRWERSRWRHTFTLVTKYPHIWRYVLNLSN
jgi:cellulose synthase/poly-beta-1,6-N-acetylglucosamine synthase-like glycosyltransferase